MFSEKVLETRVYDKGKLSLGNISIIIDKREGKISLERILEKIPDKSKSESKGEVTLIQIKENYIVSISMPWQEPLKESYLLKRFKESEEDKSKQYFEYCDHAIKNGCTISLNGIDKTASILD